jgi:hypothetical protein
VTIPQGTIWQELRSRALDTLPEGCQFRPATPPTLRDWLQKGAYSVASVQGKSVRLDAATHDVGALLFAEAALLLDHAQEHALQLRLQLSAGNWVSPAWSVVAMYYWAYYTVLALTRMLGRAPWFLADEDTAIIRGLLPAGSARMGAGPYMVNCGPSISSAMRSVEVRKSSQTRLHDAVWRTWFEELRQLANPLIKSRSTATELRLYLPQVLAANAIGDAWPSDCRNLVNYVPGFAYGAARGRTPTASHLGLSAKSAFTPIGIVERLEADASAITPHVLIRHQLGPVTRLLTSMTFSLDMIANGLFVEVAERRMVDRRWIAGRAQLRAAQWGGFADLDWPILMPAA